MLSFMTFLLYINNLLGNDLFKEMIDLLAHMYMQSF